MEEIKTEIESEIMNKLRLEYVSVFKHKPYMVLRVTDGKLKATVECFIRDNMRDFKSTLRRLKFYKEDLGKGNDKEIKVVIEKFKDKLNQHEQFLIELNLN